ncbi:MAG: DUF2959 family protein [Planctomycetes bacterium]|nr:DUF2959 family protein [Planctomycetota bacterium]
MTLSPWIAPLLVLTWLPLACKSTEGHDRAEATALRVESVGGAAGQTQLRLDESLAALEQIVATAKQDPKPAFQSFTKALGSFQKELANLASERAALQKESQAWFDEFAKQNATIQDPALRTKGEKRLADLRGSTTETSSRFTKFIEQARGFESRLGDLRKFLGNDLTPAGIEAVSSRIKSTAKEGRELAAELGELSKKSAALAEPLRAARQPAPAQ